MFGVGGERRESEERPDDWDLVRLKALQLTAVNLQVSNACFYVPLPLFVAGQSLQGTCG